MPGKSKKGGGLESSPVYKKQGYGEGVSPFTMKSGNTTPFKQMGSSPLKQELPKSFNIKGDPSTTPGFSETKIGKKAKMAKKFGSDVINKEITRIAKGGKAKVDVLAKKTTKKAAKKTLTKTILKGASKIASKFLGPIGTALTAIEIGKTAKETIPSLKERARSGNVNIGRKL